MTTRHDTPDPLSLDAQLCFSLYATQLAVGKVYRRLLTTLGLTYPQYLVMLVLWEHSPQSVSQLGQRLTLNSATLTPLLKRLEQAGYLTRRRAREDERQVDVALTADGQALRAKAEAIPERAMCESRCSAEELMTLKASLDRLRERLTTAVDDDH